MSLTVHKNYFLSQINLRAVLYCMSEQLSPKMAILITEVTRCMDDDVYERAKERCETFHVRGVSDRSINQCGGFQKAHRGAFANWAWEDDDDVRCSLLLHGIVGKLI